MPIRIGNTELKDVRVGNTPVREVRVGNTLVWQRISPPVWSATPTFRPNRYPPLATYDLSAYVNNGGGTITFTELGTINNSGIPTTLFGIGQTLSRRIIQYHLATNGRLTLLYTSQNNNRLSITLTLQVTVSNEAGSASHTITITAP